MDGVDHKVSEIEEQLEHLEIKVNERSFAWELIENARRDSKRWFIALIVVLALWFSTIAGFIWFIQLYDYTSYDYQQDGSGYNNINTGVQGNVSNGAEIKDQGENQNPE